MGLQGWLATLAADGAVFCWFPKVTRSRLTVPIQSSRLIPFRQLPPIRSHSVQRRKLLFFAPMVPMSFYLSRHLNALAPKPEQQANPRQQATELNELAISIKTSVDARLLVDFVADIFSKDLLPAWGTEKVRKQIAAAEFATVSDQRLLISEGRLARAWNGFVQAVGANPETLVTEAEVHNLRDGLFSIAGFFWQEGNQTIWTAPGIYAVDNRGTIADGCRAVESLRVLWDLANMPSNLTAARARAKQNVFLSDQFREAQRSPTRPIQGSLSFSFAEPNPIEIASSSQKTALGGSVELSPHCSIRRWSDKDRETPLAQVFRTEPRMACSGLLARSCCVGLRNRSGLRGSRSRRQRRLA